MPKPLFYLGTAFCLFIALAGAQLIDRNTLGFVAVHGSTVPPAARSGWAIVVAVIASVAIAAIFVRMATLLAARNLFGGFLALFAIGAAVMSLSWLLMLQTRMVMLVRRQAALGGISEMHFIAVMTFAYFAALTFLALRPYFRVQASRFLSALVVIPMPLFALILVQELFVSTPLGPLPAASPASAVLFAVVSLIFFSIAVHCIRHRHMFLELTNLRELLDSRIDPAHPPLGDVVLGA